MPRSSSVAAFLVGAAGVSLPLLVAFEWGAVPGNSGGPAGYVAAEGGSCTACHFYDALDKGAGGVELIGAPRRYRPGAVYDLTVKIRDTARAGAGFEISAEGSGAHIGAFRLSDPVFTQNAGLSEPIAYVTQNQAGYDDSVLQWSGNGGLYEYHLEWEAPVVDLGSVTFFVAGNAVDDEHDMGGDHYYTTYRTLPYAQPGDGDGDTDVDLGDLAVVQRCFDDMFPATGEGCEYVDFDDDGYVSLSDLADFVLVMAGPTSALPPGYVTADPVRGGQLYDKWWAVGDALEPTEDHPLWAFRPDMESNTRTGSATWRCKECHGWDYKGVDGAYGSGSHRTGFGGVLDTTLTAQQLFDLLRADSAETGGHDMASAGMSNGDIWDVVKMTLEGTIDTDPYIAEDGTFNGNEDLGGFWYGTVCSACHGDRGADINFGTDKDPEYVGTVAAGNPWEFLHKIRFSQPGTPMPSLELFGWSLERASQIGAKAATLRQ